MTLRRYSFVEAVCCSVLFVTGLSAQTVKIIDANGKSITLTAAQISSLPRVTVDTVEHDAPAQFEGVSLARLLELAASRWGIHCVECE